MPKSKFFTGQPVLGQILSLIPRSFVNQLARQHHADRYYKSFKAYDHLVSMLFCAFNHCSSLREVITGLQANAHRIKHLGIINTPRRSTLADANGRRSASFFEAVFHGLFKFHYGNLPDSLKRLKLYDRLFVIDSTTITLFCDVLKGAGTFAQNGKRKGGLKAHVLSRIKDDVPQFVHLSPSAHNDRVIMPMVNLPSGSIIIMDRAYVNYKVMQDWTDKQITWVTRLNPSLRYTIIEKSQITPYQRQLGVVKEELIWLGNPETAQRNPLQKVRLITFYDSENKREFLFLTNNLSYSPVTIAKIYKSRWSIELLFKRVKQNFQLNNFLGDNENAIKVQMWCTLIADLLIKIIQDRIHKLKNVKWSFANLAGLIRQHLTTYIDLLKFLANPEKAIIGFADEALKRQLDLFKT